MNFFEFDKNLYRGSQPNNSLDTEFLSGKGIKTIVDLETGPENERLDWAVSKNIIQLEVECCGFLPPTKDQVRLVHKILLNKNFHPIYLHCVHGHDRTGFMVASYRMKYQGWSLENAAAEMIKMGNSIWLQWWIKFLEDRINYAG